MTGSLKTNAASRRLEGMRGRLNGGFDQNCTIDTPTSGTPVSNGAGGWLEPTPEIQEGVRCQVRFPTVNPNSPKGEAAQTTIQRAEIRLPLGTSVSVKSRIVVGEHAYEVQGHDAGRSYATEVVCDCLRADDGENQT